MTITVKHDGHTLRTPRFKLWCRYRGKDPEQYRRTDEGELPRIGQSPWTLVFTLWIQARWADFRALPQNEGRDIVAINTDHAGFDAWLNEWVEERRDAKRVALALCAVNPRAGQPHSIDEPLDVETRSEHLLDDSGPYGPYVAPGDPHGWSPDGRAVATVYMEPKGGPGDCEMPLDYWENGLSHSIAASDRLGDLLIEFVNAAVASVYRIED